MPEAYWTAIVTEFDWKALPATGSVAVSSSGTALPVGTPAGTRILTWYRFTNVGVRPENTTTAFTPPIVAVMLAVVW